ncbi:MAG: AMP-binding protein [Acidimicrobiia bacterium]
MANSQITVLDALARRLESDPDGAFLDFEGSAFTARQIDDDANRLANALAARGVQRGDRVASLLENGAPQVVTFFAALKLGAVAVPINTAYKGEFLRHQLADSGAKAFVVLGDFASRVQELDPAELLGLGAVVVVGAPDHVVDRFATVDWDTTLAAASADAPAAGAVKPSDLACFIYTAGTTGPSKGCMLSHHYVVSLATQVARAWGRRADDVVFTPLPLFHLNAIAIAVVGTLLMGGSASIARRFSVSNFWPEVARTDATMVSMLGSIMALIGNAPDHPQQTGHKLRLAAGAPVSPELDQIWNDRFGCDTFSGGYGLTEGGLFAVLPPGVKNKPGAMGMPNYEEFDVRLVDDNDFEVAVGEIGEVIARPKQPNGIFQGYWNRPEATLEVWKNLWFHTGDLARLDEDGFMFFVDRKKDALRRRGENISSFEMEAVFRQHPSVNDLAVHAVASEVGEDDVKVTIVLKDGEIVTEEAVCRWCIDKVPYFAVPRYIEFRSDLPRNPVGRVLKYQLRDEGVTDTTWDREASGFTFERR